MARRTVNRWDTIFGEATTETLVRNSDIVLGCELGCRVGVSLEQHETGNDKEKKKE